MCLKQAAGGQVHAQDPLHKAFSSVPLFLGEKATKKKKTLLPKIIITGPLDDSTSLNSLNDLPESQTIRDVADYGPYQLHMKPSTVEAYYFKQEAP
nr:PREDICTED: spermatogenesis-associated protein 33 [Struthio camelus australis]